MNEALAAALIEVERHVGRLGWDQPARLFALVGTADLLAAEPSLAEQLSNAVPDGFSSVESEEFRAGSDLTDTLAGITWPPSVAGCVLALERFFLPPEAEGSLPDDLAEAARVVAEHPQRLDLRVVVGVTRDGDHYGLARVRDSDGELLSGPDLVPALSAALAQTLE